MKIAYISPIYFSDVDLSYLSEAQKTMDITYLFPITSWGMKGAAINISKQYPSNGIFHAAEVYPELQKYGEIIDLNKTYVINYCGKSRRSLQNFMTSLRLVWFLIKNKFDIIHITEFPAPYQYPLYLLRKKIVLTVHDPFPHSASMSNLPQIIRDRKNGLKLINNFILLNKKQKQDFIKFNHLETAKVYDSCLGAYYYLNRMYPAKHKNNQYILFFGQITEHKGLDILFPAMQIVHKKFPNVKLISAGRGKYPIDTTPYEQLDYFDIRNHFIPDEELAQLISNAMFVVCPYKDATQSGVVMSAYAFNKPVIATNVGGLPEMVIDGQMGIIVPPNNVEALSKAIKKLLENQYLLDLYSSNIEATYSNGKKSWKTISENLKLIYKNISSHDEV